MIKVACACIGLVLATPALAQKQPRAKTIRFWNLTENTITKLYLAPTGTDRFGPNQCANDKDGTVDVDERLPITNTMPGRYDAKFEDKTGRVCIVRNLEIKAEDVFTIDEHDLKDCRKPRSKRLP